MFFATLASASSQVVEDAEDGSTDGWRIYDSSPVGALIENVAGDTSQAIRFTSTGTLNGFIVGSTNGTGLNIQNRYVASWRMRAEQNFIIYFAANTSAGLRYIRYQPTDNLQPTGTSRHVITGLGQSILDGEWRTFERDLQADLNAAQPDLQILSIPGILIRGSLDIDDIVFSDTSTITSPANQPPNAQAGEDSAIDFGQSITLDGSSSSDADGQIVSYQWLLDGTSIGSEVSFSWTPSAAGLFDITLTVTDNDGDSSSDQITVNVIQPNIDEVLVVEDAEDGSTGGWRIYDSNPTGALIENVAGDTSQAIRFTSTGTLNGFILGSTTGVGLNIQNRFVASWRMRAEQNFIIYFAANTSAGLRYIRYQPTDNLQPTGTSRHVITGLGQSILDGEWRTFERDLQADLNAAQPDLQILSIPGILIRGSLDIDDIVFSDTSTITSPANQPPNAQAGEDSAIDFGQSITLDGSSSSDADGQIVSYQWLLDGTSIGSEVSFSWTPSAAGLFDITLTVTDNDGDSSSDQITVNVIQPPPPVPDLDDYELVFNDEFRTSQLDPNKWQTGLLWGPYLPINNEEQLYVDTLGINQGFDNSPFTLNGETLTISAIPTSSSIQPPERPAENSPAWDPYPEYRYNGPTANGPGYSPDDVNYLSGIITSYDAFRMTHGYVEARVKVPTGRGLWPAFWLLNTHYVEDSPEIDVMEFLGQNTDEMYHTYHYFDVANNYARISTPTYVSKASDWGISDWTQDFHTYGMAWSPREIVWYVDGVETRRITDQDTVNGEQLRISGQAMYLIANLAVGGNWPGSPDNSTPFPADYEIDYIRAYKRKLEDPIDLAGDYQLMFSDEFSGSTLDTSKWNTHYLWGPYLTINSEEQYYIDANDTDSDLSYSPFTLDNGTLTITADLSSNSGSDVPPQNLPPVNDPVWQQHPEFRRGPYAGPPNYTSGIITSYDAFKFAHGYAEIRARIPSGDGLWPAFWLLNAYYVGPLPEIDIMEILGENPNQVYHTYHRSDTNGVMQSTQFISNGSTDYSQGFHTYGVRWEPGKITWYIDGNPVHTYEDESVAYQIMYVIANLAVGGNFNTQAVDPSALPATFDIDYIRVYQEKDTP